jgi:serine/threonine-protein kinase RsbT
MTTPPLTSNESVHWTEQARLPVGKMTDVLLARFVGRDVGAKLGFAPVILTRIATVISEIARNVVQHAGCPGEIQLGLISEGARRGLRIVVVDQGRGLEPAGRLPEAGPGGTLGGGLSGARRLVDQFHLQSSPGTGTTVTMDFWQKELAS